MSNPFVGEIRMFGGSFAPAGWAFCSGQLMAISENDTLFTLIGTTYGGDGQSTFGIPDLQGRIPMHQGGSHVIGEKSGTESVTLTTNQIPSHNHVPLCNTNAGTNPNPSNAIWAAAGTGDQLYAAPPTATTMNLGSIAATGGSQPHDNMSPFLVISFIISLFGIFPSQT
jgi:microcystin-dependent protein